MKRHLHAIRAVLVSGACIAAFVALCVYCAPAALAVCVCYVALCIYVVTL